MKRSVLTSSLVLALATALAACGGGGGSGDAPATGGTDAPAAGGGDDAGGDPVAACQKISDGIQADVDALIAPITNAGAVIDGIANIKTDVKVTGKVKLDVKKLMVEVNKVVTGTGDADIASLQLDADSTAAINTRIQKLKDLIAATKNVDQAAKDLLQKITDGVPKIVKLGAPVLAKAEVTLKNPFAKDADKKDAQAMKDKIGGLVDGFKAKVTGWQTALAGLPAQAKDIPAKLAKLK